ncbi:DUF599 domain-containing protein [Niveibacterium umoris]|uniref:Putative membrane protein n=1 Tax=Niveibacterium umoris TaxID=1193620 RepID=A0A840BGM2_9RHOO|nr:DUF599 domain-containing protein [Niveibacterium umoris]MBB4012140.1 putative membrane protein [Niveibacterium umoris]
MFSGLLHLLGPLDWIGLAWFLVCWVGYGVIVERGNDGAHNLLGGTHRERLTWARQMMERENRVADVSLVGHLMGSVSFYANTSVYILAGLMALVGGLDRVLNATADLPFAAHTSRELLEFKLLMLLVIFVVAYFNFTWSLRQFNVLSIVIGAAPAPGASDEIKERAARKQAEVNTSAGDAFNSGIRAYYFGLAVVSWCINGWVFIGMSTVVLIVLARRDFVSRTAAALRE